VTLGATVWIAYRGQNKRFDDFNKRFDGLRTDMAQRFAEVNRRIDKVIGRLDRIERKLENTRSASFAWRSEPPRFAEVNSNRRGRIVSEPRNDCKAPQR
jgi:hypothetical protein